MTSAFAPPLALAPSVPAELAAASTQSTALLQTRPLESPAHPRKIRRNGRIASLPKIPRDMVNRMLWNSVPYKNIVAALDELGYTATERNVSNWATGGYLEWSLAQEHVLQNRTNQDHLLDFLRRDDAPELGEVGLQAAATRLSQVLLQKLATADDPEAQLDNYSRLVDLLCRLNREIAATQKNRDDSRRTLGRHFDPVLVKDVDEISALRHERSYSNPGPDFGLPKPPIPAAVPPDPTGHFLAQTAREEEHRQRMDWLKRTPPILAAKLGATTTPAQSTTLPSAQPSPTSAPSSNINGSALAQTPELPPLAAPVAETTR
jgi:hypothetical protein